MDELRRRWRFLWRAAIGLALIGQALGLVVALDSSGRRQVLFFLLIPVVCLLVVMAIAAIANIFILASTVADQYEGASRWAFVINAPIARPERLEAWARDHGYSKRLGAEEA